ncbi:MAG: hypothetical protein PHO75_02360 [Candidatus Shapirobacteria bacterium]|nr:hypothetical protein [Candidatus Shapirobacteria bacterium]
MTQILLISVLILLITLLLVIAILKFSDFYKFLEETTNVRNKFFVKLEKKFDNKFYNTRKRDENLLRELHKTSKLIEFSNKTSFDAITEMLCMARKEIKECSKKCTGIDNVSRQNLNQYPEIKKFLIFIKKSSENSEKTLTTFNEIVKKSNHK